jgi:hypothetical protein
VTRDSRDLCRAVSAISELSCSQPCHCAYSAPTSATQLRGQCFGERTRMGKARVRMAPSLKVPGRNLLVSVNLLHSSRAADGYSSSYCAIDTAFRQQRLKAWQPILTPKTVLPTLFIVGVIFAPIGALLVLGSNKVSMITLDYTDCDTKASSSFSNLPRSTYDLRSSDSGLSHTPPQWSFTNITSNPPATQAQCTIRFNVPADLRPSVFLYYKLTNFYQNHRRYVKSYDPSQLRGDARSASTLNKGDCKPLAEINGKAIYPCGLIANSIFNGQRLIVMA